MTTIKIITFINAKIETVFDANRNIDLHQKSTSNETAIDGIKSGLINFNETVTWRGKHFGFYLTHKSRITAMEFPSYFVDEMEKGRFKSFKHHHFFEFENGIVKMTDLLCYETPFSIFGKIFDCFFLKKHLTDFILERNAFLKEFVENEPLKITILN
jgi:ligand-binding SRPBCC domain-containing protein